MNNKAFLASMEVDNVASRPIMVRHVEPTVMIMASEKNQIWKRVAVVTALGALFGFATSFLLEIPKTQRTPPINNKNIRQTSVVPTESETAKQLEGTPNEIERLKTRNRRLEVLVEILQQREQAQKSHLGLKSKN